MLQLTNLGVAERLVAALAHFLKPEGTLLSHLFERAGLCPPCGGVILAEREFALTERKFVLPLSKTTVVGFALLRGLIRAH